MKTYGGVEVSERDADHSAPSITGVKNAWSYTPTPQYVFMAWFLVKNRNNFTLYNNYAASEMLVSSSAENTNCKYSGKQEPMKDGAGLSGQLTQTAQ
jgi:hypothetical protein